MEVTPMCKKCCPLEAEIPVSQIRQQVDYARTVCSDIFNLYAPEKPDIEALLVDYQTTRTKLSMMLDFLLQARLWCDAIYKEKEKNEKLQN